MCGPAGLPGRDDVARPACPAGMTWPGRTPDLAVAAQEAARANKRLRPPGGRSKLDVAG